MFNHPFTRQQIADAHMTYLRNRTRASSVRRPSDAIVDLSYVPSGPNYSGREWDDLDFLADLGDESLACYLALVAKTDGAKAASTLADQWGRIHAKGGVTIVVANSDDDPTQINVHVVDPIASAWADAHGSLDGGTWEEADGPEFVYDILYYRPGLFEELIAEGFRFDFSQYDEPDARDLAIATHASECKACDYDWHKAEEHYDAIYATWEVRDKDTGEVLLTATKEETRLFAIAGDWWRKEWRQVAPHTETEETEARHA